MIARIVKLTLLPDKIGDFQQLFDRYRKDIAAFPGCLHLQGLQGTAKTNIFFTYSHWDSEESLNKYRNSDLFNEVWPQAKEWFQEKPEAWTTNML
ncbi:MAG: antibiotic biosynthesis monooxygenase [Bacteroidetes bacterium]|nr:antibiotic biosynthesis monooxygenase [Bacteroidota bacterium]